MVPRSATAEHPEWDPNVGSCPTNGLPLDRLALLVLEHCDSTGEWNSHNFLLAAQQRGVGPQALSCLSEAMNWLIAQGLVARDKPGQTSAQSINVTRAGKRVLSQGISGVIAAARLNVDLHQRLGKVRTQFLLGEYELAAFAAMREVEIRVRDLAKADHSLIGVKLMREAFRPDGGPLADANWTRASAWGTCSSSLGHRHVQEPIESQAS